MRGFGAPRRGFTLLELLMVIAIMGIIAAIAVPSMRGTRQTNALTSANSQLINDLNFARKRAINERTTVYILFEPPDPGNATNLLERRAYRLFAGRTVGDQPGRPTERYLTGWIKLPDGVIIPTDKFDPGPPGGYAFPVFIQGQTEQRVVDPFPRAFFPAPRASSPTTREYPYLAFNSQGGLDAPATPMGATVIPLFWLKAQTANATESRVTENYNHVVVDGLTGRATVDKPEVE